MDPITAPASNFSAWEPLSPNVFPFLAGAAMSAVVRWPGHVDLFATCADGSVWRTRFDDSGRDTEQGDWVQVYGLRPASPEAQPKVVIDGAAYGTLSPNLGLFATVIGPEVVELMMLDGEGVFWVRDCAPDDPNSTTIWRNFPDQARGAPGTVLSAVSLDRQGNRVFLIGADGALRTRCGGIATGWDEWESIGDAGIIDPCRRQRVAAVARRGGRVQVFVVDRGGRVITSSAEPDEPWQPWTPVGAEAIFASRSQVTAILFDPDHLLLVAAGKDGSVWIAIEAQGTWGPWTAIGAAGLLAVPVHLAVSALSHPSGEIELFVVGGDGAAYGTSGTAAGRFPDFTLLQGLSAGIASQALIAVIASQPGRVDLLVVHSDGVIHAATRGGPTLISLRVPRPPPPPPSPLPPSPPSPPAEDESPLARYKHRQSAREIAAAGTQRYALLVGIGVYAEPAFEKLQYCVDDVLALGETLRHAHYASVVTLHDSTPELYFRPTTENIKLELKRICKVAGPSDFLLVHFSCHGTLSQGKERFYLVTANTRADLLEDSALAADEVMEILKTSQAGQIVVLLDACHSGATGGRDISQPGLAAQFVHNVFEQARGTKVLAASMKDQVAKERSDVQRGVFTSFVIEALTLEGTVARADRGAKGFVSFNDLDVYVCNAVTVYCEAHRLAGQTPNDRGECAGDLMVVDYRSPAKPT